MTHRSCVRCVFIRSMGYLKWCSKYVLCVVLLVVLLLLCVDIPGVVENAKDYYQLISSERIRHWTGFPVEEKGNYSMTIVTGLFDIGRGGYLRQRRSYNAYLLYLSQILMLDINLTIFIEAKGRGFVRKMRKGRESRTNIVTMKMSELEYYPLLKDMERIMGGSDYKLGKDHGNVDDIYPLYNLVTNNKITLMHRAIQSNVFGSSYFIWLDAGYGHGEAGLYPVDGVWNPKHLWSHPKQVTFTAFEELRNKTKADLEKMYVDSEVWIAGGLLAGGVEAFETYYRLHKQVMAEYLAAGKIDDDQTLLAECYVKRPDNFRPVLGDWHELLNGSPSNITSSSPSEGPARPS